MALGDPSKKSSENGGCGIGTAIIAAVFGMFFLCCGGCGLGEDAYR